MDETIIDLVGPLGRVEESVVATMWGGSGQAHCGYEYNTGVHFVL